MTVPARLLVSRRRPIESLTFDVAAFEDDEVTYKLETKINGCIRYLNRNRALIVDYADRFRHGAPIATGFVESAVNQVVSKRVVKKQQMSWSMLNAHRTLQVRAAVLNEELRSHLERCYPSLAATNDDSYQVAA